MQITIEGMITNTIQKLQLNAADLIFTLANRVGWQTKPFQVNHFHLFTKESMSKIERRCLNEGFFFKSMHDG